MHPADSIVEEYQNLLKQRADLDRKLAEAKEWQARHAEIESKLVELRQKINAATNAPA